MQTLRARSKNVFSNVLVRSPDGTDMFRCKTELGQWYLNKNLAEEVSNNPLIIQLSFQPKGQGHAGDPFYLQERHNNCIVCGTAERLTLHHMVPRCYKRHLPLEMKSRSCAEAKGGRYGTYDTMALCDKCHGVYETQFSWPLKQKLANKVGIPMNGLYLADRKTAINIGRTACAIKQHGEKMPKERLEELYRRLKAHYGKDEITEEDLDAAIERLPKGPDILASRQIVKQLKTPEEIDDFFIMWRRHFVDSMKPKYMPDHWQVDRRICS